MERDAFDQFTDRVVLRWYDHSTRVTHEWRDTAFELIGNLLGAVWTSTAAEETFRTTCPPLAVFHWSTEILALWEPSPPGELTFPLDWCWWCPVHPSRWLVKARRIFVICMWKSFVDTYPHSSLRWSCPHWFSVCYRGPNQRRNRTVMYYFETLQYGSNSDRWQQE